ncbi:TPA: restriction endonuclease subunit S [Escherichia coli]|uniref:Restriction endonuclease subunit S n=1 Tax=Escherichia coli TaxID=562 RepID=A0A2X7P854_ECOLX|nr:restriction endonuclease subunit S [Escherichia coli]EIE5090787.1 restriction endonuclease subunit S [Escherichia coli]MBF7932692.1 restriction endonuclease subunit S [Escherichia coli]MBM0411129.1 restriction endonuclease subunit S [Escherichia coli]MCV7799007.1 restriction endonuclease subunit S [Escherichia coli]MCV7905024.1 restriction endonuclease subunit S [Escherichia coli]
MSELSYLEKLLDGIEVEWVTLGSMADIGTGSSNRQDGSENGIYPFYVRSKNILKSDTFEFDEVAIVIPGEGGIGDIFHYVEGKYALHQRAYRIRITTNAVDTKFLYYFMSSSFKQYILTKSVGATAISIRKPMLEGFKVPIPSPDNPEKSLAIQSEIVRILDTFTALTAELTAELNMRKKQYNYYRDRLFSFGAHDVKRLKLGELCVIGDGLHGTPEYDANGDYFFINGNNLGYQKISFNDNTKKVNDSMFKKHGIHFDPINTVFLSINGTIGNVSFYNNEKIVLGKSVAYFKIKSPELHTRYLFYFLQTNYAKQYFENQKTGSTIKNLGLKSLRAFEIPIPSDDEQLYIVATMDKFYNLTNSITEGLPREIELRQKQYEYYRDLLFSFPKPETVSN